MGQYPTNEVIMEQVTFYQLNLNKIFVLKLPTLILNLFKIG